MYLQNEYLGNSSSHMSKQIVISEPARKRGRLLLFSYAFPPMQTQMTPVVVKTMALLSRSGYEVDVLCAAPFSHHLVNKIYGLNLEISKDTEFACDRRLDSSRFRERTGFQPESWEKMITEINSDQKSYGETAENY